MAFDATKPNNSQLVKDIIIATRDNDNALKEQEDAHEANVANAHGLGAILLTQTDYNAHKANVLDPHGLAPVLANVAALLIEMVNARGSKTNLTGRISVALNLDGSIKLSTLNNKWINPGDLPTYISTTSFSVPGDKTLTYIAGAQLRFTAAGNFIYGPVASRSFSGGVTTVVMDPSYPVLTLGIGVLELALIAFDNSLAASSTTNATNITSVQGQVTSLKLKQIFGTHLGLTTASQIILRYLTTRAFTIPSGVTNARGLATTAATALTTFNLAKNGVNFGTMEFAIGGTIPTWVAATAASFVAGDLLTIVAPSTPDVTLATITMNIPGVLP